MTNTVKPRPKVRRWPGNDTVFPWWWSCPCEPGTAIVHESQFWAFQYAYFHALVMHHPELTRAPVSPFKTGLEEMQAPRWLRSPAETSGAGSVKTRQAEEGLDGA